ncbi:MAG: AlkZ-related protein, partial [Ktedonobacteraceae bacterium]
EHGNKSGWNSTCYMLSDHWMEHNGIVVAKYTRERAKKDLYSWIEQRWNESAIRYVKRYL